MYINIHRVDDLPENPKPAHGYAVSHSAGNGTCDLYFVSKDGSVIKQVAERDNNGLIIADSAFDASAGLLPVGAGSGDAFFVGTAGIIDGKYFPVGSMLVALTDDASESSLDPDWFGSVVSSISPGNQVFTCTADQTTFTLSEQFIDFTLLFSYRGYAINFNDTDMIVDGNEVTLPNLGFKLESTDEVTFTYMRE